jgi:hypothetical protein
MRRFTGVVPCGGFREEEGAPIGVLIGQSAILLARSMGRNAPLAVFTRCWRYLSSVPSASTIRADAANGYRSPHAAWSSGAPENKTTTSCSMSKL